MLCGFGISCVVFIVWFQCVVLTTCFCSLQCLDLYRLKVWAVSVAAVLCPQTPQLCTRCSLGLALCSLSFRWERRNVQGNRSSHIMGVI